MKFIAQPFLLSASFASLALALAAPRTAVAAAAGESETPIRVPYFSPEVKPAGAGSEKKPEFSLPLKFSGFLDARFSTLSVSGKEPPESGNAESGFGIEDGAFTVESEMGKLKFEIEIPFRRSKVSDTTPSTLNTVNGNRSANNALVLGVDTAQAYAQYEIAESLSVRLGQFNKIFGVEGNQSIERVFGQTGLVYLQTMPPTHTGAMVDWKFGLASLRVFAANPDSRGTLGTGEETKKDENYEYGGALSAGTDALHGQVGYMTRPILRSNSDTAWGNRTLLDAIVGTKWDDFALDVEWVRLDNPNKDTATPGEGDQEAAGTAGLVLAQWRFSEQWSLGGRYEMLKDDPGANKLREAHSYGGSLHYHINHDAQVRLEYTGYDFKDYDDHTWHEGRFNVATVLGF